MPCTKLLQRIVVYNCSYLDFTSASRGELCTVPNHCPGTNTVVVGRRLECAQQRSEYLTLKSVQRDCSFSNEIVVPFTMYDVGRLGVICVLVGMGCEHGIAKIVCVSAANSLIHVCK